MRQIQRALSTTLPSEHEVNRSRTRGDGVQRAVRVVLRRPPVQVADMVEFGPAGTRMGRRVNGRSIARPRTALVDLRPIPVHVDELARQCAQMVAQ